MNFYIHFVEFFPCVFFMHLVLSVVFVSLAIELRISHLCIVRTRKFFDRVDNAYSINLSRMTESNGLRFDECYFPLINKIPLRQSNQHTIRAALHQPDITLLGQENTA